MQQQQQQQRGETQQQQEELNARMRARNLPTQFIPPRLFEIRASPTRYVSFPVMLDARESAPKVGREYSPAAVFAPNIRGAPDFAPKVDLETELQRQYAALQRRDDRQVFVPATSSDLFAQRLESSGLLGKDRDREAVLNLEELARGGGGIGIGGELVHNHTRTQLRGGQQLAALSSPP